jgi:hypothetical protein
MTIPLHGPPGNLAVDHATVPHRPSTLPLAALGLGLCLFLLTLADAAWRGRDPGEALRPGVELVAGLGLTDLALFTEARYTRHLTQADLHSAFQDHPLALDHFPSGSLVPPPAWWQAPDPVGINPDLQAPQSLAPPAWGRAPDPVGMNPDLHAAQSLMPPPASGRAQDPAGTDPDLQGTD